MVVNQRVSTGVNLNIYNMEWIYTQENPLRVFEAFSGYGAMSLALKYLGIPHKVVGISEIEPNAVKAYMALHKGEDIVNYGDISKVDWNEVPDFDLLNWSSPCQDYSNAGLQRGGQEGSGTRSSLIWELKRCLEVKQPKYLLTENVKALVSDKFRPGFLEYCRYLETKGYTSFNKVINSRDMGIPQNRERIFVVSILGESWYNFPQPQELKLKLKDMLEEKVDERYYLDDKKVAEFIGNLDKEKIRKIVEWYRCELGGAAAVI